MGAASEKCGENASCTMVVNIMMHVPSMVTRLGAIQMGKNSTAGFQKWSLRMLSMIVYEPLFNKKKVVQCEHRQQRILNMHRHR